MQTEITQRARELDQQIGVFRALLENHGIGLDAAHIRALQEWLADAQRERAELNVDSAPKRCYSNTAYAVSVDTEYYGRGYVSSRSKNFRSCYVWRTGVPDQPVDESSDDDNYDPYHDEDGEPLYIAHCETREMASALCAWLNCDDSFRGQIVPPGADEDEAPEVDDSIEPGDFDEPY